MIHITNGGLVETRQRPKKKNKKKLFRKINNLESFRVLHVFHFPTEAAPQFLTNACVVRF